MNRFIKTLIVMATLVPSIALADMSAKEQLRTIRRGYDNKYAIQDLLVTDDAVITDDASIGGDATVTGNATITGTLDTTGDVTSKDVTVEDLTVTGNAGITSNLSVTGVSTLGVVTQGVTVASGVTITGDVTVNGNMVGDGSTDGTGLDDVTVNDLVASNTVTTLANVISGYETITHGSDGTYTNTIGTHDLVLIGNNSGVSTQELNSASTSQIFTIIGSNDDAVTFLDGSAMQLAGNFVMDRGDALTLLKSSTAGVLYELSRSDNN
jgi:hypothetical protein